MANTKTAKPQAEKEVVEEVEELNLEKQVTIRNIANWTVGFARITSIGDVNIPAHGVMRISRGELVSQSQNGNKLINGTDGIGSHATVVIEDIPTLIHLGFIKDKNGKQFVFSNELVQEVFDIKNQEKFEATFKKTFVTRAERISVMSAISELGINDYNKISFAEKYTGFKVQ